MLERFSRMSCRIVKYLRVGGTPVDGTACKGQERWPDAIVRQGATRTHYENASVRLAYREEERLKLFKRTLTGRCTETQG